MTWVVDPDSDLPPEVVVATVRLRAALAPDLLDEVTRANSLPDEQMIRRPRRKPRRKPRDA